MTGKEQAVFDPVLVPEGVAPRPQNLEVSLTGRCNLRCRYCFYNDEMVALSDLPTESWLAFFREAGELAVQRVTLSGGEVLTRPDLFELIDAIIDNRMRYSLLTNGTLIRNETITALQQGKRRLRLDSIQVSIDGSRAGVHNKSRPPDSFDRALRGLRLLRDANLPVTVRVTINRHNVDDLENIARLLLEEIHLPSFSTNEADRMGTARCYGQDVVLTDKEREQARATLLALNRRYDNRISATAGPLALAEYFGEIDERINRGETSMPGYGTLNSCGGVFCKMAVLHDGTMVPCNLLPTLTMGIIGSTPLQEAWLHHPSINGVRHRSLIPLRTLVGCRDCNYTEFCAGGCPATVLAQTGRLHDIDPVTCYRRYRKMRQPH